MDQQGSFPGQFNKQNFLNVMQHLAIVSLAACATYIVNQLLPVLGAQAVASHDQLLLLILPILSMAIKAIQQVASDTRSPEAKARLPYAVYKARLQRQKLLNQYP